MVAKYIHHREISTNHETVTVQISNYKSGNIPQASCFCIKLSQLVGHQTTLRTHSVRLLIFGCYFQVVGLEMNALVPRLVLMLSSNINSKGRPKESSTPETNTQKLPLDDIMSDIFGFCQKTH